MLLEGGFFSHTHRIHGTGIFTYIYHKHKLNVGRYTIHGSYGINFVQDKIRGKLSPFFHWPIPRDPITLSEDDWGVQSPPQQSMSVSLPFSEGDWILTVCWLFKT